MSDVTLDGRTQFYIGVNVSADDLSEWSRQKMTDFFTGVAKVVHAAEDSNWPKEEDVRYSARREGLVPIHR